jgi:hypothetical protein
MTPKPKPADDTTAADPDKNARLETYEQEVERASVESVAEHPEGSAPPLERLVDAHPGKQRKS